VRLVSALRRLRTNDASLWLDLLLGAVLIGLVGFAESPFARSLKRLDSETSQRAARTARSTPVAGVKVA
jgi:hypothetical protein